MAPKKNSKVNETEMSNDISKEEPKMLEVKTTKSKKKEINPDEKETKSTKKIVEPVEKETKTTKSKKKEIEPVDPEVKDIKPVDLEVKVIKKNTESVKKEVKATKKSEVKNIDLVEEKEVTKSKKKVNTKKVEHDQEKLIESTNVITTTSQLIVDSLENLENPEDITKIDDQDPQQQIKLKLEKTKKHWLVIVDNIHNCHSELQKWENEKTNIVKELKELLDQYQTDDHKIKGFMIDNKVLSSNIKNDIIPVDSESDNSESDEESSDSDDKQTLLPKKGKPKTIIKTTKGNLKNLKLVNNDSESDSD
jgi:hypothetical protein